jgi:hypothetical protein
MGEICGRSESGRPCSSKEVKWFFTDLDGDGAEDLVELIIYRHGEERDQLHWKTQVNSYLLKDKKMVSVSPGLLNPQSSESRGRIRRDPQACTDLTE